MTTRDILRLLISGISIKRPAKEAGIAAATYIFVVWCAKMALLVGAATVAIALVPKVGPVGAGAIVAVGFLVLAGVAYLVLNRRGRRLTLERHLESQAPFIAQASSPMIRTVSDNLVPLLIAGVATVLVSRLTR